MQFDYSSGFLLTAINVALIVLIGLTYMNYQSKGKNLFISFAIISGNFIIFFIPLFLLLFPLVNLISQYEVVLRLDFLEAEINSGVLALRISSIMIFINIVLLAGKKYEFILAERISAIYFQYVFYGLTLVMLWILTIMSKVSLSTVLLSWAIFFIIDDWAIITSYSNELKTHPIKAHANRILFFNTGILLLLVYTIFIHFGFIISLILTPFFFHIYFQTTVQTTLSTQNTNSIDVS